MSGATDSGMVKIMGIVMAALALIAVVCVIAARSLSGMAGDPEDPLMRNALMQRIQPVASVRTSLDDLPAAPQTVMASSGAKSGADLVQGACSACHIAGVAGAPALDDSAEWAKRAEAGLDALVASVINGKGAMPARGGSAYSDEEIRVAVEHMLGTQSSDAGDASSSVTETAETAVADAGAAASSVVAAVVGQAPEVLPDTVRGTVDGVCAGCHIAGVANAPKIGDKEAWQLRADKGMEALSASVINGLGAMPARGASTLTDEEIAVAIQYLMSK